MQAALDILNNKNLSITDNRLIILGVFLKNKALTGGDIEKKTRGKIDRITIYRNLQVLAENAVIHLVPTIDNSILYALSKHPHNHPHFICDNCKQTFCLYSTPVPEVKLPDTFKPKVVDVVIRGVCESCKQVG